MALCPFAEDRLIPHWNQVRIKRYRRVNFHVAVSNSDSIYHIFARSRSACSHFYVNRKGEIEQYIDTKYRSASDRDGNDSTISVETEGGVSNVNGETWSSDQVKALIRLWAWLRDTHDITNQVAKNTYTNANSSGLSWHRLGVQGNFEGRPGILSVHYGAILYSGSFGKECPGDAKILQIPGIWEAADGVSWKNIGQVKPVGTKPKPAPVKPDVKPKPAATKPKKTDKSGDWPENPMPVKSYHTTESDAAWRELMHAIGYKDKDLGKNLQSWLDDLEDPRTGTGYYPMPPLLHDGIMGSYGIKALQRKLYDTKDAKGRRLYDGKADGDRGQKTIRAEYAYLNLPANRGVN